MSDVGRLKSGVHWTARERVTAAAFGLAALALLGLRRPNGRAAAIQLEAGRTPSYAEWDRRLAAARRVPLNDAPAETLARLPGIGPVTAARIVAYRRAHGPFQEPSGVMDVPGIGPQTYGTIKDYLY